MEMNVNEWLGLFAALIRCDNSKFVCFGLQNHTKACIIWRRMQMPLHLPHKELSYSGLAAFKVLKEAPFSYYH